MLCRQRLERVRFLAKMIDLQGSSLEFPAIFVTIGNALPKAGPAGLFIGFLIWGCCVLAVNECYGKNFQSKRELMLIGYRRDDLLYARD